MTKNEAWAAARVARDNYTTAVTAAKEALKVAWATCTDADWDIQDAAEWAKQDTEEAWLIALDAYDAIKGETS